MLKTYSLQWPGNGLLFRIPFQASTRINSYGQATEFVEAGISINLTIAALIRDLSDEEWVYWCIDDKFLIDINAHDASYFATWVEEVSDPKFAGLCFCRARRLLLPDTASTEAAATTDRADLLLLRYNYNQIWLHQFLRVGILKRLLKALPHEPFAPSEMDTFKNNIVLDENTRLYVTKRNHAVFGESSINGRVTTGCVSSMKRLFIDLPKDLETVDAEIRIGHLPLRTKRHEDPHPSDPCLGHAMRDQHAVHHGSQMQSSDM